MVENAIDRLKNRQRKKVNPRNPSLNVADNPTTEDSQTINQSNNNDSMTEVSQTVSQSNNNDSMTQDKKVNEPIRRTVRLDPQVDDYMDTLCKEHRVTKETLIEAAMLICSKNQRTLNKVITDAQDRYKDRKLKGELKKLQTMSKKLKGF